MAARAGLPALVPLDAPPGGRRARGRRGGGRRARAWTAVRRPSRARQEGADGGGELGRPLERRQVPGALDHDELGVGQARDERLGERERRERRPPSRRSRAPAPRCRGRSGRRSARPASASSARRSPPGPGASAIARAASRAGVVAGRDQARHEVVEEGGARPHSAHQGRRPVAALGRLGGVRLGAGVGQHERRHPLGVAGRQRQGRVAAQRQPADRRPPAVHPRDAVGDEVGEPVDRGRLDERGLRRARGTRAP